ncbi:hypothetical protein TNIN_387481 [Trichonephila inaurata madagascariensis]|uniref:Uncharacterized protein n=1 Tax=Trichonephila inaurata madagascariensis TaxID=2747483 RepID=A0A8X7C2N1_9ARAC|nr:hypothetical protein TNIN_387481 [Trichonephila inaurata madagascariensis]
MLRNWRKKLQTIEEVSENPKILEMYNPPNVNDVYEAPLDPEEQEVELEAINNYHEETRDFNTELKENIDRMLEKAKQNIRQYKKRLKRN